MNKITAYVGEEPDPKKGPENEKKKRKKEQHQHQQSTQPPIVVENTIIENFNLTVNVVNTHPTNQQKFDLGFLRRATQAAVKKTKQASEKATDDMKAKTKKELMPMTAEQKIVIDSLRDFNVMVQSVAGSGKTTTAFHVAKENSSKRLLLITYNKRLKDETRKNAVKLGIKNIEVCTYHSFCVKYYSSKCHDDGGINAMLKDNPGPLNPFAFDILILDEVQDMSPLYYRLFCKLYTDNNMNLAHICVVGDVNQSIFEFNRSDVRYMKNVDTLFDFNGLEWKLCRLSVSFRITDPMGSFINKCMVGVQRMRTQKSNYETPFGEITLAQKPRYIICDCYGSGPIYDYETDTVVEENRPFDELMYYMDVLGYNAEDIFILAPSVKPNPLKHERRQSIIVQFENKIKKWRPDIHVFVPTQDDSKLDDEVIKGKLVFASIHSTKGLERKVVILMNFDSSFYIWSKGADKIMCPNQLYVATTRAQEHLSLLHHYRNDYLPFLNRRLLEMYCHKIEELPVRVNNNNTNDSTIEKQHTSATKLLSHLPFDVLDKCHSLLTITQTRVVSEMIKIETKKKYGDDYCETVSDLTGTAIPNYYEYCTKGTMSIYTRMMTDMINNDIKTRCRKIDLRDLLENPSELLHLANCWNTHTSGLLFKLYQIDEYDWLSQENLLKCKNRLDTLLISKEAEFEKFYECKFEEPYFNGSLTGYADCVDANTLYEFKCVHELTKEHDLQVAIYMFLYEHQWRKLNKKEEKYPMKYVLYNILTDETREIECDYESLCKIIRILFQSKAALGQVSDAIFMQTALKVKSQYHPKQPENDQDK